MPAGHPSPIVPTPASLFPHLRGRRVVIGVPGLGFRRDLRADDPVVQASRTYVPVLTEQDYYRAETEQIEVFAPLVPIDRVWVENAQGLADSAAIGALDSPPPRVPRPATGATDTLGRRLIQAVPDGYVRDLRAVTETYLNSAGVECVRVCGEPDWYRWALLGSTPTTAEVPAEQLWIE